jgi:hypothetical protein
MGLLGWVIMGLALWHFTIWLPDRFWGGIVGALIGAIIVGVVLYAVPGALIGMALTYVLGMRREVGAESDRA